MTAVPVTAVPVLDAVGLDIDIRADGRAIRVVEGVDLTIAEGETLAIVGESGSGKTTIARALLGLRGITNGRVSVDGSALLTPADWRRSREAVQAVFQDPFTSLDPRWSVGRIVAEPLRHRSPRRSRAQIAERLDAVLTAVGLDPAVAERSPVELSGGMRQRVGIARALAASPRLIIADEPVSALDVSVQAQVVNVLSDLQTALGLSFLLISHDLALVHHLAHRVAVLYLGRIVETGTVEQVIADPQHPYTASLLAASGDPGAAGRERPRVVGEPPSMFQRPSGCEFHPRCPIATARCAVERPALERGADGAAVACFHPGTVARVAAGPTHQHPTKETQ